MSIAKAILRAALDCGYDNCGIIGPEELVDSAEHLKERMGKVSESAGFYNGIAANFSPVRERFPWARSVVVLAFEHGRYRYPSEMRKRYAKAFFLSPEDGHADGYDCMRFEESLTAQGIRWHKGSVPLRHAAMKAGLGIIRKNNFFYTDNGSFVSLFAYITDCDARLIQSVSPRPCADTCALCQRACKSGALCAPYTMNPMKCISFWTTFGKGSVPPFLEDEMFEEWVVGCDDCQDACPYNRRHNWDEGDAFSNIEEIAPDLEPERLLEQTDDFLRGQVIPKTDNHLMPEDTGVLRINAQRALRNRRREG